MTAPAPGQHPARLTVLVIGASAGLGRAIATALAARHRVLAVGRDPAKTARLASQLRDLPGQAQQNSREDAHVTAAIDIATRSGWQACAEFAAEHATHLDAVIYNAGVMLPERQVTADGIEEQFAVHHLAPFALTARLWPLITAGRVPGGPGGAGLPRIVNVNSAGHQHTLGGDVNPVLDFDDLQAERRYDPFLVYGRTKLANLYFTYELARRHGSQVTVNALHPGVVKSDLGRHFPRWRARLAQASGASPERAAGAVTRLAVSPDIDTSGGYYDRDRPARSSPPSYDTTTAARLWDITAQLAGTTWFT